MNLTSFTIAAAFLLSTSVGVVAAEKPLDKTQTAAPAKTEQPKKAKTKSRGRQDVVTVTGSHINQNLNHRGLVSTGPSPMYVLDSASIRNSGAVDLRELLTHKGVNR